MVADEELVRRLAAGDHDALAELLRRYEDGLSHFLFRRTGGRDVEDLFQETWMRVVRHVDRFDRERKFSTWLFQIAVNLCRDWQRRPPLETATVRERVSEEACVDRVDARIDAQRLLSQLPEEQREVVILRYYHDLRESDVAEILGVPTGTVKSRMHAAIRRLATALEEN